MGSGFGIEEMGAFNAMGSTSDDSAAQVRGASLHDAIASGAHGIQGTKTAAALEHLAGTLAKQVDEIAAGMEQVAELARVTGKDYADTDANAAARLRSLGR